MDRSRWQTVRALFDELVELSPDLRAARLEELARTDPALSREVAQLLRADAEADDRLARVTRALLTPAPPPADDGGEVPDALGLEGRTIAHFRVHRPLGAGGMAMVYLAEDLRIGRAVALKVPLLGRRLDAGSRSRFLQEARAAGALDHPNLCSVYEAGESDEGLLYLAMALYRGETLKARLARDGALPTAEAVRLAREVVHGLTAAHDAGIVHRDLKPGNLMLLSEGGLKILDFGLAKVRDLSITGPGALLGTAAYMSPEQIRGAAVDGRADLWALGVVLYEMLTGRLPFQGETEISTAHAILHHPPLRPAKLRPEVPPRLDDLLLSLLEKAPDRRPSDGRAVDAELAAVEAGAPAGRTAAVRRRLRTVARHRPWLLGAAAATALAVGLALPRPRSPPAPSLVSTGVLAPRDRVLIADFADLAGDPLLAAAVTEAFRVDLAESRLVRVLSPRQVRGALARMERAPDVTLDDTLAREIALREGLTAFVTGSVARVPGAHAISLQLVDAREGELLVGLRETADDTNEVVAAVDRLSERLRARIGEPLSELRAEPALAQVTTASLPALRHFTEGQRLILAGDRASAVARFEQAVALDTGFASAWRLLGVTYGDMIESGRMVEALDRALANRARLPYYERHHTEGSYAGNVPWDIERAIAAYDSVLRRYPDDIRALNNLGHLLLGRRRFAEAESLLTRAVALDTTVVAIQAGLVSSLIRQGEFERARGVLDLATRRFPGHYNLRLAEIYLAAARQDYALAERHARTRLAAQPSDTLDALDGRETLAGIVMTLGRLAEAERESETVLSLSRAVGSPARHLSSALRLGHLELRHRGSPARALARVHRALAAFPLDRIPEGDRPYDELARLLAAAGQPERAESLLRQASATGLRLRRRNSSPALADRLWFDGLVARLEGRPRAAVADLRRAAALHPCTICVLPDLARAHEAAGDRDSAIATYERYLATAWEHRFEPDALDLGPALKRLGDLCRERGDAPRARAAYGRLLRLWRRADPELRPMLAEVRAALEHLGPDGG